MKIQIKPLISYILRILFVGILLFSIRSSHKAQSTQKEKLSPNQVRILERNNEEVLKCIYSHIDSTTYYLNKIKDIAESSNSDLANYYYQYSSGLFLSKKAKLIEALNSFRNALKYAEKTLKPLLIANSNQKMGSTFGQLGRLEESKIHALKAIKILPNNTAFVQLCEAYLTLGNTAMRENNYQRSIVYYQKIDSILFKNNINTIVLGKAALNTANIYAELTEFEKAKEYYQKAINTFEGLVKLEGSQALIAKYSLEITNSRLATLELYMGNFEKAEVLLKKSLKYFSKTNNLNRASILNLWLGILYVQKSEYKLGVEALEICLIQKKELNDSIGMRDAYQNLGHAYYYLGKYKKSIFLLNKTVELNKKIASLNSKGYLFLANSYSSIGEYKHAYNNFVKYVQIEDSINYLRNRQQTNELESKYQKQKDKDEIALLKSQNELGKQKQRIQLLLFIGLLLALLIPLVYLNQRRKKKKKEFEAKLAQMQMESLKAQMSPHFMFNSINSIKGLIVNNRVEDAADQLTKFSKLMRNILNYSGGTKISLKKEIYFIKLYMDLECFKSHKDVKLNLVVDDKIDQEEVGIPPFLIQPFVENCFKHAFLVEIDKPVISLTIYQKQNWLSIQIEDNGIGVVETKDTDHKSQGTYLVNKRLELTNESADMVSINPRGLMKGTIVKFKIKIDD